MTTCTYDKERAGTALIRRSGPDQPTFKEISMAIPSYSESEYNKHGLHSQIPAVERFWARVQKSDGCWEWQGTCRANGYGYLMVSMHRVGAHRFSWETHFGPIPDGMFVCHRCDNRRCVRPDHLFLGDAGDNNRDTVSKGRYKNGSSVRTHCIHGHPLSGENLLIRTDGNRRCRQCKKDAGMARYFRHKALGIPWGRERYGK